MSDAARLLPFEQHPNISHFDRITEHCAHKHFFFTQTATTYTCVHVTSHWPPFLLTHIFQSNKKQKLARHLA
jgi:hypothetical protein